MYNVCIFYYYIQLENISNNLDIYFHLQNKLRSKHSLPEHWERHTYAVYDMTQFKE